MELHGNPGRSPAARYLAERMTHRELSARMQERLERDPHSRSGSNPAIQMRVEELISGVRARWPWKAVR